MNLFRKKKSFFTKDQFSGEQFSIGAFTYGSPHVKNYDRKSKLSIGRYCSFAAKVTILLGGEHRSNSASTYPFSEIPHPWPETMQLPAMTHSKGDTHIGNDVWLGYGVTILSGITVGDGAVLGAGALVCKDVPPYAVVGGNPAKILKMRFDSDTVARLLKLSWWQWPEDKVRANIQLICNTDINSLLLAHGC